MTALKHVSRCCGGTRFPIDSVVQHASELMAEEKESPTEERTPSRRGDEEEERCWCTEDDGVILRQALRLVAFCFRLSCCLRGPPEEHITTARVQQLWNRIECDWQKTQQVE